MRRDALYTAEERRRQAASEEEKKRPRICESPSCSTKLLADNPGPLCGPCITRWRQEKPNEKLPSPKNSEDAASTGRRDGRRKSVCANGHVIAEVGRHPDGGCRECKREQDKKRRERRAYESEVLASRRVAYSGTQQEGESDEL